MGTRPYISESHSEISTRVPVCIATDRLRRERMAGEARALEAWALPRESLLLLLALCGLALAVVLHVSEPVHEHHGTARPEQSPRPGLCAHAHT